MTKEWSELLAGRVSLVAFASSDAGLKRAVQSSPLPRPQMRMHVSGGSPAAWKGNVRTGRPIIVGIVRRVALDRVCQMGVGTGENDPRAGERRACVF